jgi:23S rRNA (uracil1939-C5)-methyltransferase
MTQFTISRLGHLGDGIVHSDDAAPLFAPRTLPGEIVTATPKGDRLTDIRIVTPSDHRVKAPCPHYNACGGCALKHADDGFVAGWKRDIVLRALSAHGLQLPDLPEVITSPPQTRRRASLHGRRTKKGALVGFHARAADTITPVPDCLLLDPALLATLPVLEDLTRLAASRAGEVTYHLTLGDTGVDLAVENAKPLDDATRAALSAFGTKFARVTWNGEAALQAATPGVRFGTARVVPPPAALLQATPEGEAALVAAVLQAIGPSPRAVVDLFSGCGTFSFPIAARTAVHAVEGDADLIAALDHGVRYNQGMKPLTTARRDLFRNPLLPDELAKFDAAVIDPPRAGAEAQVAQIAASTLRRVAFVSCSPVTFARDAATLTSAGFTLDWLRIVDQFRWSPHIEIVAQLTRPE